MVIIAEQGTDGQPFIARLDPGSSASALLPLTKANSYTPEVLFCGGTTANLDISPSQLSATYPASKQCSRMVLNTAGIAKGWQIEQMPMGRIMSDALLTPDGKVIIVNGASQGIAGCKTRIQFVLNRLYETFY